MAVDRDEILRRRIQIRRYIQLGYSRAEMLNRLQTQGFYEGFKNPSQALTQDIKQVLKQMKKRAETLLEDLDEETFQKKRIEYINQQQEIFERSLRVGEYEAAIKASKNIAKAFGISTEETLKFAGVVGKTDLDKMSDEQLIAKAREDGLDRLSNVKSIMDSISEN